VFAQAQDGSGTCNANFSTPADGASGRQQMFLCTRATPMRDGDFDNSVIFHESAHGLSTRIGGLANGKTRASCLIGPQQMGEGWSDWYGLVLTGKQGDKDVMARGTGQYLFAKDAPGLTIRQEPYSTDQNINNFTYASINPLTEVHAVGAVWTEAIWEVYWALTNKYGFEGDLLNFDPKDPKEPGNKRALLYITEGLKDTACPQTGLTFLDGRDGIIEAAMDNFGGQDVCTVWKAFAQYGLGSDATSVDPNPASARNGFQVPAMCQGKN